MIGDAIAVIELLKKHYDSWGVVSALFSWDGTRIEGSERLSVERIPVSNRGEHFWFFRVVGPPGYVFVHMPVDPNVSVDFGATGTGGEGYTDALLFRYVPNPFTVVISGSNPNVRVNFIVFGYPPKALLKPK